VHGEIPQRHLLLQRIDIDEIYFGLSSVIHP
jgi:hypothetical protein